MPASANAFSVPSQHSPSSVSHYSCLHIPASPAISLSSPLKTMSHSSLNCSALHSFTTSSPNSFDIGRLCFHRTASLYFFPALFGEAPTAVRVKCGCRARRRMKRWPTLPVAPSTPVWCQQEAEGMVRRRVTNGPHLFFGKSGFGLVKCSASILIIVVGQIGTPTRCDVRVVGGTFCS